MPNPIIDGEPPTGVERFVIWPDIAKATYRVTTIAEYHAKKSEVVGLQPRILALSNDAIAQALKLAVPLDQPV